MNGLGKKSRLWIVAFLLSAGFSASSFADLYGFRNVTANSVNDAAIGEAQFQMEVTNGNSGQVQFAFRNLGPAASSITDVYFDDAGGKLMNLVSITNGTGVSFSSGAAPPNLPGWSTVSPAFSANFAADSDAPPPQNGVNPGESLGISFNLLSGISFADVLDNLEMGTLRVGIHAQAFAGGGSESFINRTNVVPVPSAFLLGILGLGSLGIGKKLTRKGEAH
jgi:hypothetical protein